MTTSEVDTKAWLTYPFSYRNNRGTAKTKTGSFIRFGIPLPRGNERPKDKKGGDRIGFTEIEVTPDMVGKKIAAFINIEIKGDGDELAPGQIEWHNFVLEHNGLSEVWYGDGSVKKDRFDETTQTN